MATYIELQQQIQALQAEAEALRTKEREGVIERMKEAIAVYDITAADLGLGSTPRKTRNAGRDRPISTGKKAVKATSAAYTDAAGNTWGGRGPRPKWLREALARGENLESFRANAAR